MKSKIKKELIREIEEIAIFLHSSSIKGKNGRFWHRYNDSNRIDDSEKNEFIYGGNAGICLFFIELYQFDAKKEYLEIIEESVKWLYNRTKKESTTNYAFLTGRVGTAYVFALCGKLLNNEKYTKHSLDISHAAICDFSNPIKKHDFLGGLAGTLIGLIQIHDIIPESDILEGIKMGAVKLIEDLSINKTGIFWGWKPQSMAPLCGLSHGNAGYGFVFHELSKLFNDDNLLVIASICFDYENRHFNKEINNWPDYRLKKEVDDNYKFPSLSDKKVIDCVSWCHGAPGIGLLRQSVLGNGRGVITDEKLKINNALKKTVLPKGNRMARPSLGLCHGIAGNAFVFLNQRKKRYGRYKMVPEEFARYILFSKSINKGYYTTFTHIDKRVDPSLFLGLSGIGYFFLFMLNEKESSILLPKINLKSNKTEINFMEIFLKAIAKNMHPENFDKISAESFNILSKTFFNLFKEGRIKNEIEFLRIQIEELIMLSKDIVTETFFRHEKFRLRLALDNVFYMEGQYFGSVELVGNIMPSGNYEIKKLLKDNNFILCNNVEFKRFNGQTGTKYYLYINHFSNVESIEINQFQFLLINEFSILTTFEDAFIRIGEYIDLKQDSEQIRRLILDQFLFLYQKNVVKSSPKNI